MQSFSSNFDKFRSILVKTKRSSDILSLAEISKNFTQVFGKKLYSSDVRKFLRKTGFVIIKDAVNYQHVEYGKLDIPIEMSLTNKNSSKLSTNYTKFCSLFIKSNSSLDTLRVAEILKLFTQFFGKRLYSSDVKKFLTRSGFVIIKDGVSHQYVTNIRCENFDTSIKTSLIDKNNSQLSTNYTKFCSLFIKSDIISDILSFAEISKKFTQVFGKKLYSSDLQRFLVRSGFAIVKDCVSYHYVTTIRYKSNKLNIFNFFGDLNTSLIDKFKTLPNFDHVLNSKEIFHLPRLKLIAKSKEDLSIFCRGIVSFSDSYPDPRRIKNFDFFADNLLKMIDNTPKDQQFTIISQSYVKKDSLRFFISDGIGYQNLPNNVLYQNLPNSILTEFLCHNIYFVLDIEIYNSTILSYIIGFYKNTHNLKTICLDMFAKHRDSLSESYAKETGIQLPRVKEILSDVIKGVYFNPDSLRIYDRYSDFSQFVRELIDELENIVKFVEKEKSHFFISNTFGKNKYAPINKLFGLLENAILTNVISFLKDNYGLTSFYTPSFRTLFLPCDRSINLDDLVKECSLFIHQNFNMDIKLRIRDTKPNFDLVMNHLKRNNFITSTEGYDFIGFDTKKYILSLNSETINKG